MILLDEKLRAALEPIAEGRENGHRKSDGDPAGELTKLLALDKVDLHVTGAALYGRGSSAIAHVHLSDGSKIALDPLGKYGSPSKLTIELAIQVGAEPVLKAPMVARVMALLHRLAEHHETMTREAFAADWGRDFLQTAQRHPVDMADQGDRWRAFQLLASTEPVATSRAEGTSIARQSVVLEDPAGVRYVRCGWLLSFVRAAVGPYSSEDLARDMRSVGWDRSGRTGRIKASAPGRDGELAWSFYVVPAQWETTR